LRLSARLTLLLLVAVFAVNIYRAATQGITLDEAFTYQHFVAPPLYQVMTSYDANHHVVNSLLAMLTTRLFGVSELTLRIPSLLGGLIYLLAVRAIVLYVFSAEWAIAAFALLSLNPFVLDYLSAARGYGLALGFLMCALWFLLRSRWSPGGICCGLAVASNLSFAYPVVALAAMVLLADVTKASFGRFLERVSVPAVVIPFVMYVLPLSHANSQQFAFSAPSLMHALRGYVDLTFLRKWPPFVGLVESSAEGLAILILVCSAVACVVILRNRAQTPADRVIVLNGGAMVVCLAITWLAHVTVGTGYPLTRYGLYWPVMISLGGVALVDRYVRMRALRWTALVLPALCIAQFLYEFEVRYYGEWRYDAGSKRIAAFILRKDGTGPLRIACSPLLQYSLGFYSNLNHAGWVIIEGPKAEGDLHVLMEEDFRPDLKLLYRDAVSHVVVMQ
jgi:hypothetical protein